MRRTLALGSGLLAAALLAMALVSPASAIHEASHRQVFASAEFERVGGTGLLIFTYSARQVVVGDETFNSATLVVDRFDPQTGEQLATCVSEKKFDAADGDIFVVDDGALSAHLEVTFPPGTCGGDPIVVTVDWTSAGGVEAERTLDNDPATTLKSVSASITIGGTFSGTAPSSGSIGLLVTSGSTTAADLVNALAAAGCTVESLAVLQDGAWLVYISGAPEAVNAAFPASLANVAPFMVRCA